MKLGDFYLKALQFGIEHDPRGMDCVNIDLAAAKESFETMREPDKKFFDLEKMNNPYADSRILTGSHEQEIQRILAGIDIGTGELILSRILADQGRKIDAVVAHHPHGRALCEVHNVMKMFTDILGTWGVPVNVTEDLMEDRRKKVMRFFGGENYNQVIDMASILELPLICLHTPADNAVTLYLQNLIDDKKPRTLQDLVDLLHMVPEYGHAAKHGAGPVIVKGAPEKRTGRIRVDMTGGTGFSETLFKHIMDAGIGTLVTMHIDDKSLKQASDYHVHIVIAGHMASDSLGLNLLLDASLEPEVDIVPCGGFIRVKPQERQPV